jgi:hypothetical protein
MANVLWHDDIRKPPNPNWFWARTNDEAKRIFLTEDIHACSLDHDLGMENEDADADDAWLRQGTSPNGTGLDLIEWMIEHGYVPDRVYIHSMNSVAGKRMADMLFSARNHGLIADHITIYRTPYDPRNYV